MVDVVDENLFITDQQKGSAISAKCNILSVLDLGLGCCRDLAEERFEMKDVVTKLNQMKSQILSK